MRKIYDINNGWYYNSNYQKIHEKSGILEDFTTVNLPHTNVELPYHYFNEEAYQIISCYKYPLNISQEAVGKKVYIQFEGVMAYAKVYVNGEFAGEHKGGYTPFRIRIDQYLDFNSMLANKGTEDAENILTVVVDSTERADIPPFGGQIDYLTYGGIYRGVSLCIFDDLFIEGIKIDTFDVLSQNKKVKVRTFINNEEGFSGTVKIKSAIVDKTGVEVSNKLCMKELKRGIHFYEVEHEDITNIKLWDLDNPELYSAKVEIEACVNDYNNRQKEISDVYLDSFGFRCAEFKEDGFYLNGNRIKIKGLNRHQSYPYIGYAMPKRAQIKDAEILKNDLHLNMVRTSHYPQLKEFIYRCDELGLMVFEEIPGWQHIGDEQWKEIVKDNVREMIQRDWNHPSIVIWGVRINESQDDDELYKETNQIAHELDASRQTGGVRYITNSRLFEDVYTFNDFNLDGIREPLRNQQEVTGLKQLVPYLVTEYNGHMYPTKRFDAEERQMEHALRHIQVLNASFADENICGAIGWCAFDYNTHKDFGAGDRICYHGIMDMFRIHKFAAYAYKSQVSPEIEAVLEPVTYWARGERSIGGPIPLVIFTNCDYIEFEFGNIAKKKVYPNRNMFPSVEYAPVIIDFSVVKPEEVGAWGMKWEDLTLKGYYKDQVIVTRKMSKNPVPSILEVVCDDFVLDSSEKDATRIVVKLLDQYKNLLPFADQVIDIELTGPGRLQGPNRLSLKGGCVGFWVETTNEAGKIEIKISTDKFNSQIVKIKVE